MLDARTQCCLALGEEPRFPMSQPIVTASYRSTADHIDQWEDAVLCGERRPATYKKTTREHTKRLGAPQVDCSGNPRP
jgi:hypothetical protein